MEKLENIRDTITDEIDNLISELPEEKRCEIPDCGIFKLTLAQVRKIAQAGLALTVFKIGDLITSPHRDGEIAWIVVGVGLYSVKLHMRDALNGSRCFGENNDWESSTIRKWSNDAENGFLSGFSAEDAEAIAPENIITVKNGKANITVDKLYLLSRTEMGLGDENGIYEGSKLAYYDSNKKRQKVDADGNRRWYCLRSPCSGHADGVRLVGISGALDSGYAVSSTAVALACTIR
ncbi:MAG: DUF6273 domain-containing protein [Eubacteriales bacterium]|nr:DUF6273 domain-containing protein [Eubacteriales bacterium]